MEEKKAEIIKGSYGGEAKKIEEALKLIADVIYSGQQRIVQVLSELVKKVERENELREGMLREVRQRRDEPEKEEDEDNRLRFVLERMADEMEGIRESLRRIEESLREPHETGLARGGSK